MERLVFQPSCGCRVYRIMNRKPNPYRIQYCPLHLAAPEMYEALCSAVAVLKAQGFQDTQPVLTPMIRALAKAEGK